MQSTLRKTANLIGRGQWRRWLILVLLAVMVSVFEMTGAVLVFVLVSIASDPSAPIEFPIIGDLREVFDGIDETSLLTGLIVVLAVFFLTRAVVRLGATYAQSRVAHNTGARLSNRLVTGYLALPYAFHLRRSSSELIRNSHQAVSSLVSGVFVPVINITAESFMVIGMLVVMVVIAPAASAIAVGVIGAASALLLFIIQPRLKRLGRIAHEKNRETLSTLQQALYGIRDVRLLAKEAAFSQAYARSRLEMARVQYVRRVLTELPRILIELSLIGLILVILAGSIVLANGDTTVPIVGLFAYVGLRLQPSIQKILGGLNSLRFASAPIDDIYHDLERVRKASVPGAAERLSFSEAIVFDHVTMRYEGAHEDSLRDINITINQGEQIGICGPTGGGKTTLVDLLSGLLEPSHGSITVDGKSLANHTREWQRNLGVVSQAVFLVDDTLRRNIALGLPDSEIDEGALNEAVELAQLRGFVETLPAGLDTSVGERGVRVSGGQRQRIAIARALYRRPEVLIFDEGTSALDNSTEAALMEAIEALREHRTIILVAHRLSTVTQSDRVLFVEGGRITGEGSYEELLTHNSTFRMMAEA